MPYLVRKVDNGHIALSEKKCYYRYAIYLYNVDINCGLEGAEVGEGRRPKDGRARERETEKHGGRQK